MRATKQPTIDKYLMLLSPEASGITAAISLGSDKLGVSISAVNRWRKEDRINTLDTSLKMIMLINKSRTEERLGLKDLALICNYDGKFR